jgi:hypothetical protein
MSTLDKVVGWFPHTLTEWIEFILVAVLLLDAGRLMCTALLAAVALIVALPDPTGRRARCFAGARGGYLGPRTILQALD